MARSQLNLVCREFAELARPMQWRHLVLHHGKDLAYFLRKLLPRYGPGATHVSLDGYGVTDYDDDATLPRGFDQALELIKSQSAVLLCLPLTKPVHLRCRRILYATFRHTFTLARHVQRITLAHVDWPSYFWRRQRHLSLGSSIRRLDVQCPPSESLKGIQELLRLVRFTLEELHVDMDKDAYVPRDEDAQYFDITEPGDSDPPLPLLKVLVATQDLAVPGLKRHPVLSKVLRRIAFTGLAGDPEPDYADIVRKHHSSLETFIIDDRGWKYWHWADVRAWWEQVRPASEACKSAGIAFRWLVALEDQATSEEEQTPPDLVGCVEVV